MAKDIVWSPSDRKDFSNILYYIDEIWDRKIAHQFSQSTFATTLKISNQPKLFRTISIANNIRKCVLTKHNTLFYREKNSTTTILRIFDTRKDPKKLKFIK